MQFLSLALLGLATAAVGTVGGLGGAMLLVPLLVLTGTSPAHAAPLGLFTVAAGSLAASADQIEQGLVHHRLGVTLEIAASAAAFAGAALAGALDAGLLRTVLAVIALCAAAAGAIRRHDESHADVLFAAETAGEWPGTLSGMYREGDRPVAYQARNAPAGLAASAVAGVVSGISGTGGGFIKTPAMCELMGIPLKVAAATTTFTIGLTAASALVIHASIGTIDYRRAAAVVAGAIVGGRIGARAQPRLPARAIRLLLSGLLAVVGIVLLWR